MTDTALVKQMKDNDAAAISRMRRGMDQLQSTPHSVDGRCAAFPLLESVVEGTQQSFRNDELLVEYLGKLNWNGDTPPPPPKKNGMSLSFGPFRLEGFDVRDVGRLIMLGAFVIVLLHLFGMQEQMREVSNSISNLNLVTNIQHTVSTR